MHTANGGAASLHFLDCAIPGVRWNGIVAPEGLTICGVCVCRRRRRLWLCNSSMHMMIARQHSLYEHTNNEWMHFYEPILFAAVLRVSPQLRDHRQYFFIHFYSFHTTTEWALRTLHQLIYYKYDYILFERWCVRHNFTSPLLPPFVAAIFEKWIKYMQNEKRERERKMKIMNKILCIWNSDACLLFIFLFHRKTTSAKRCVVTRTLFLMYTAFLFSYMLFASFHYMISCSIGVPLWVLSWWCWRGFYMSPKKEGILCNDRFEL